MPIRLDGVSKSYDRNRVLQSISMTVQCGEVLAVMGPSGSGKTTLLSLIGLLIEPTEGLLEVNGSPVPTKSSVRHVLRRDLFGWVFQTVNVLSRRTAADNVSLSALAHGLSRDEALDRAERLLTHVGLGRLADEPVNQLSGGEVQRVCIARALASEPHYLLADEPTGQLDRATSLRVVRDTISLLRASKTGMIVATHDPVVAGECDRVVRIVDGELLPGT